MARDQALEERLKKRKQDLETKGESNPAGGTRQYGVWEVPEHRRSDWVAAGKPSRKQQPGMWDWESMSQQEYNALTSAPDEAWREFPRGSNPAGGTRRY